MIFLDIGEILEKGVHESSVCDTGVYRFPNFHIFKQFPFQIPYNLDHFFQFSIIVTVCVFVRHLFSFYPFYFDFHSARIIFYVSSVSIFMERKQDYNVTSVKNVKVCF